MAKSHLGNNLIPDDQYNQADNLLQDLLDLESGLSDWELKFIEDLRQQFEHFNHCTKNQFAKLEEIAEQKL